MQFFSLQESKTRFHALQPGTASSQIPHRDAGGEGGDGKEARGGLSGIDHSRRLGENPMLRTIHH